MATEDEARAAVDTVYLDALKAEKPLIEAMIELVDRDLAKTLSTARAYLVQGYYPSDVIGDEWRHRVAVLDALHRFLIRCHERQDQVRKALRG